MAIDWNHIASLLHVAEKAAGWPTLQGIRDKAHAELDDINKEAAEEMKAIREKLAKAAAEAEAKRAAAGATGGTGAAHPSTDFGGRLQSRFSSEKEPA